MSFQTTPNSLIVKAFAIMGTSLSLVQVGEYELAGPVKVLAVQNTQTYNLRRLLDLFPNAGNPALTLVQNKVAMYAKFHFLPHKGKSIWIYEGAIMPQNLIPQGVMEKKTIRL